MALTTMGNGTIINMEDQSIKKDYTVHLYRKVTIIRKQQNTVTYISHAWRAFLLAN